MRKTASLCVLGEMKKWQRYKPARSHLEREGEAMLRSTITIHETWVTSYESDM